MTAVTSYHNPDCGTSRNTPALLRNAGIEPTVIEYLKSPPDRATLQSLISRMGIGVRELLREKGTPYAGELHLADSHWTDDELVDHMLAHPMLINRGADRRDALGGEALSPVGSGSRCSAVASEGSVCQGRRRSRHRFTRQSCHSRFLISQTLMRPSFGAPTPRTSRELVSRPTRHESCCFTAPFAKVPSVDC